MITSKIKRFALGLGLILASSALNSAALAQDDSNAAIDADVVALELAKTDTTNWRAVDPERLIIFETTKGRVLIETFPEIAPKHVTQFTTIVRSGDYDGTSFHRVIDGFMAQGGDIEAHLGRPSGLSNIEAEFTFRRVPDQLPLDLIGNENKSLDGYYMGLPMKTQSKFLAELSRDGRVESYVPHCPGVVSTARLGNDINSGSDQFFLMRNTSDFLDKQYSPWGRIVSGQDVVDSLKTGEPVQNPDILTAAKMAADLPKEERPSVWVQKTDGPEFTEYLAGASEAEVCDLPPVPTVVEG
ncbi:MAG: peptidylprolyl isomerase [Pseudomonadota bacterium]